MTAEQYKKLRRYTLLFNSEIGKRVMGVRNVQNNQ